MQPHVHNRRRKMIYMPKVHYYTALQSCQDISYKPAFPTYTLSYAHISLRFLDLEFDSKSIMFLYAFILKYFHWLGTKLEPSLIKLQTVCKHIQWGIITSNREHSV